MSRTRFSLGLLIGYHGCDRAVAESVLAGNTHLQPSENDYDWLGPGVYFWVDSPERAMDWAIQQSKRKGSKVRDPYVVGAFIHPGLCLNLTDYGVLDEIRFAYSFLEQSFEKAGVNLPANLMVEDGVFLKRPLDCTVIKAVHQIRQDRSLEPYDTVYGIFEEGKALFPGSGFRYKTHVQVAVVDQNCIVGGYFRPRGFS